MKRCPCLLQAPVDTALDAFCCTCGRRLHALSCRIDEAFAPAFAGAEKIVFGLRIRNDGYLPVQIAGLDWEKPAIAGSACTLPEPLVVNAGSDSSAHFHVALPDSAEGHSSLVFHLRTIPRSDTARVVYELQRKPELTILTPDPNTPIVFEVDDDTARWSSLRVPLTIGSSEPLFRIDYEREARLVAQDDRQLTAKLHPTQDEQTGARYRFDAQFSRSFFNKGLRANEQFAFAEIPVAGLSTPLSSNTVTFRYLTPAEMRLSVPTSQTAVNSELLVIAGRNTSFTIMASHLSNRTITITEVAFEAPEWLLNEGLRLVFVRGETSLVLPREEHNSPRNTAAVPLRVNVHVRKKIKLGELRLDTETWRDGARKKVESGIRIKLKLLDALEHEQEFTLRIQRPGQNRRPLAIDFGNSNTVAAFFDESAGAKPVTIPLPRLCRESARDGGAQKLTVVPTCVLYAPVDGERDPWNAKTIVVDQVAGPALDALLASGMAASQNFVASVKPRLGLEGNEIFFPHMPNIVTTADAVAKDYLSAVLSEVVGQTGCTFTNVVLSHPVRFWMGQKNALKNAIGGIIETKHLRIDFVDEATAVALYYADTIRANHAEGNGEDGDSPRGQGFDESILVFDFGGGTVDLTICRIIHDDVTGEWSVQHLVSDGTSEFGGDQITQIFADLLLQSAREKVFEKMSESGEDVETQNEGRIEIPYHDFLLSRRRSLDSHAVENGVRIFSEAEKLKIRTLGGGGGGVAPVVPVDYRDKKKTDGHSVDTVQVSAELPENYDVESRVREALGGVLSLVQDVVERFLAMQDEESERECELNRVIMTGQSSQIAFLQDLLQQTVEKANRDRSVNIEVSPEPKEAVAKGALIYGARRKKVRIERHSRSFIYIEDFEEIGPDAFKPMVERFARLPVVCICGNDHIHESPKFTLKEGEMIRLYESFVDLNGDADYRNVREDKDYRKLVEFDFQTPEGWTPEMVETARLCLRVDEHEQVSLSVVRCEEDGEPSILDDEVIIWPADLDSEPEHREVEES